MVQAKLLEAGLQSSVLQVKVPESRVILWDWTTKG